jgi:hypothetical protein
MTTRFSDSIQLDDSSSSDNPTDALHASGDEKTLDQTPYMFGFTKYQCLVLFAAWLGWGFDLFDSLLFTYAAPSCIPYAPLTLPCSSHYHVFILRT